MRLLAAMAVSAFTAGLCGFYLAEHGVLSLPAAFADAVPPERHSRFMAVWLAHGASYLIGLTGGSLLVYRIWQARGRPQVLSLFPHSRLAVIRAAFIVAMAVCILWIRFAPH